MTALLTEPTAPSRFFRPGALDSDLETFRNLWRNGHPLDDLFPDNPFRLDKAVGPLEKNQHSDVAKVQALMHDAGLFDANGTEGPTGIYSRVLMDEPIKAFQSDHGLVPDGMIKPAGPTVTKLEEKLRPALNNASGRDVPFVLGTAGASALPGNTALGLPPVPPGPAALIAGLGAVLWQMHEHGPEMAARRHAAEREQLRRAGELPKNADPAEFNYPNVLSSPANPIDPRDIAPPGFPSKPPFDPGEEHKNKGQIKPIVLDSPKFPAIPDNESHIFIYPDNSHQIDQITITERKGNRDTRQEVLDCIAEIRRANPGWKLVGGGKLKEFWLPGPGKAFKNEKGRYGDGRPGGKWLDAAFETPSGKLIGLQVVDVDRNGNPTERELNNAEIIRRQKHNKMPVDVILVRKRWQLERLRKN